MRNKSRCAIGFILGVACTTMITLHTATLHSADDSGQLRPSKRPPDDSGKRSWGIVFPVHGDDGEGGQHRAAIANASWVSLCRAIRNSDDLFHVVFIDDKGGPESGTFKEPEGFVRYVGRAGFDSLSTTTWEAEMRQACGASNLVTLQRLQGFHNIDQNMRRGYRWASQFDLLMNIDSDLFFVPDFFERMLRDHHRRQQTCKYPIISGYTSALFDRAYGANFMFDRKTYQIVVEEAVEHRSPWDEALSEEHVRWCHEWPTRPGSFSYIQHFSSPDGIHYSRDGHREKGFNFAWDSYNIKLVLMLDNNYAAGAAPELLHWDLPRTYSIAKCFQDKQDGCLHNCARETVSSHTAERCPSKPTLEEAKELCLQMPDCGGIVHNNNANYELRVWGSLLTAKEGKCAAGETSWVRKHTDGAPHTMACGSRWGGQRSDLVQGKASTARLPDAGKLGQGVLGHPAGAAAVATPML